MHKTVGDLIDLLKNIDPKTELWCRDVKEDDCWPVLNLPTVCEISYLGYNTWREDDFGDYKGEPTTNSIAVAYGLGIGHQSNVWLHDGSMFGYSSIFYWYPPNNITLAIMGDVSDDGNSKINDYNSLVQKVFNILLPLNNGRFKSIQNFTYSRAR